MTGYGSLANPVKLNPPSRIVNVHWKNLTHIAFKVNVKSSVTVINPGMTYDGSPVTEITSLVDDIDYLGTSELVYGTPNNVSTFEGWNGHAWGPIADPTISGLPDISGSASIWGEWQYTGFHDTAIPPTIADYPRARWDEVTGTGTGLFIPDNDTAEFKQGMASVHLEAQEFNGEPHWQGFVGSGPPWTDTNTFFAAPYDHGPTTPISPLGFDFSNILAVLDGKAFRAMAAASVTVMDPDDPLLVQGSVLWVLCARSKDDDPAP